MTTWKPLKDAPKDGTPLLVYTSESDIGFYTWKWNQWLNKECFTSLDEEGNYSIPPDAVAVSSYIELSPPES